MFASKESFEKLKVKQYYFLIYILLVSNISKNYFVFRL